MKLKNKGSWLAIISGCALLAINLYGLTQNIRPANLQQTSTRFANEKSISYQQALKQIKRQTNETEQEFANRISHVISQAITHIHWNEETDNQKYNQLIPIWENYFLYFMGKFSGIPEYQKYHFADYHRSLKRGIGICGDTSIIMSQIMAENGIKSQILVYPLHVVLEANVNGTNRIFDADYGIPLPYGSHNAAQKLTEIAAIYTQHGYTKHDEKLVHQIYSGQPIRFENVKHFITKKYYFEYISYCFKWIFPIMLLLIGLFRIKNSN